MEVRDASKKFNIEENEIRKRYRDGMILNAYKSNNKIVIPDDTTLIPSKQEIRVFLFQILKNKNNPATVFPRNQCPKDEDVYNVVDYLYQKGYIGAYTRVQPVQKLLNSLMLTDDGIEMILGKKVCNSLNINLVNLTMTNGVSLQVG